MSESPMKMEKSFIGQDMIRYVIVLFWSLFWLLNVVDKFIGGAHFLFVGRDRFAQVQRFFDSIGLGEPIYANVALILTAGLEIAAFVFFVGALYQLKQRNREAMRAWFFMGIAFTMITFTYFSVGDQVFGDHFELLEHGLFWFIALLSWMVFTHIGKIQLFDELSVGKGQRVGASILIIVIAAISTGSIYWHNLTSFIERTQAVESVIVTEHLYKISFPFVAGSTAFEASIAKFKKDHPGVHIDYIYTAPKQLRLGQSDGLIVYIHTDRRE